MEKVKIRITVNGNVRVNGELRDFQRGDETEVSEEEGRRLIKAGLAVPAGPCYTRPIPLGG